MRSRQNKKGSTSLNTSKQIRSTTQERSVKHNPHRRGLMSNDAENNSASSSSSLSTSSSSSSSESSVTSEEESHVETDSIIDKSLGIYCDWLSVKCLCNDSGFENRNFRCNPGELSMNLSMYQILDARHFLADMSTIGLLRLYSTPSSRAFNDMWFFRMLFL